MKRNPNALSEELLELADNVPSFSFDLHGNRIPDNPSEPDRPPSWPVELPDDLQEQINGLLILEAGFGAGPGCVGGKIEEFEPPVSIEKGLRWLSRYATIFKASHLPLEDGSVLWFNRWGFLRRDEGGRPAPRPGVGGSRVKQDRSYPTAAISR